MYKYITKEIKEEIIKRIKDDGLKVSEAANQYGISDKTVYKWLRTGISGDNSAFEVIRLQRKIKELQGIIGELVSDQKLVKKK